ncbi:MAG: RHS repeat-associated core domain-containing protein, partial [Candidatus Saccharibacteria bacterium]|nr:RHS repeat-associated core domain-containing protein [Candidatus Saccharibacteria bacterium]
DVLYSNLTTCTWAKKDTAVHYLYDGNGSVEFKYTANKDEANWQTNYTEKVQYTYDIAGRLKSVATTPYGGSTETTTYTYDHNGIRISATTGNTVTEYLVDEFNSTGYSQTLEETTKVSGTQTKLITYLIGDDVLAQTTTQSGSSSTKWLLYDGHGSTRQLADASGTVSNSYSYDAYGVLLQNQADIVRPGYTAPQQTNLLYSGENFDSASQMYNLRARMYNPLNGRFASLDTYEGNNYDPQSLHKYLYCHADPVNSIDPTGNMEFSLVSITGTMANIASMSMKAYRYVRIGLAIMDIYTAVNIVYKALTQGISSVTAGEWATLVLMTTTVLAGGKIARSIAKALICRALEISAETAQSFKGLQAFVKSKGILLQIDDVIKDSKNGKVAIGEFDLINKVVYTEPIIMLHKGGHTVSTLMHEFVHYRQWKYFVGGTKYDWDNFRRIGKYDEYMEKVAYFVSDVFSK